MIINSGEAFWKVVAAIVAIIFGTVLNAFVLTQMWAWFIVPLGVVAIGMAHAWGLAIIIMWITDHNTQKNDDEFVVVMARAIIGPLFVLLFGCFAFFLM